MVLADSPAGMHTTRQRGLGVVECLRTRDLQQLDIVLSSSRREGKTYPVAYAALGHSYRPGTVGMNVLSTFFLTNSEPGTGPLSVSKSVRKNQK
jgi:hypothetical protein